MQKVLVSACLMGENCRYDGHNSLDERVRALNDLCELVPVCPEALGGLPTPRASAEIKCGRARTRAGNDVTREFEAGARAVVAIALEKGCAFALLKDKSPSCGVGRVYDGSFTGALTQGDGVAARELTRAGVETYPASRVNELIARLKQNRP